MQQILEKEKRLLELISDIYIYFIIILFPLMVNNTGFFQILECKWHSFLVIASIYLITNISILLYYLIIHKCNYFKSIKLSIIQILAILFLIINIISCFLSPYFNKYNLFIGVGRGEGLIMTALYILSFLFISIFAKLKKKHLQYFSMASILLNSIAILQYIGFNPLNMYQNGIGTHNVSFMTTIGNIDFISALYCILLSISSGLFIFLNETKLYKIIHIVSIFMGFFILGVLDVSSGKVAILSTILIIFPLLTANNKRLARTIIVLATILASYCINIIINPIYHYDINKIILHFRFNYISLMYIIVIVLLIVVASILNKKKDKPKNKKRIKIYYSSIIIIGIITIGVLYKFNFKSGILYEVHELLNGNFDDNFGTYRIFLWKRALKLFPQYPILGSGPDTFAIRFMTKYTNDIALIGSLTINDTAANIYLTILINTGIIGLISYLAFLVTLIFKKIKHFNKISIILLIAIVCYLIQSTFNISVVIVSPIFWLLLGLYYRSIYDNIDYEKEVFQ